MRLLRLEPVRVRVYKALPGRLGLIRAKAIARAREPWVAWLHSGDVIQPGLYRCLREALTADASLVHSWAWRDGQLVTEPTRGALIRRDAAMPLLRGMEKCDIGEDAGVLALSPAVTVAWPGVSLQASDGG